jgi:hypothetical protein
LEQKNQLKTDAKNYTKKVLKKLEKVVEKAYEEGWKDCNKNYCQYCELFDTEFRCGDCKK